MKAAILLQAAAAGCCFGVGVLDLADRPLLWPSCALGLLNLGLAALSGWAAWRTFDRFYRAMAESFAELALREMKP